MQNRKDQDMLAVVSRGDWSVPGSGPCDLGRWRKIRVLVLRDVSFNLSGVLSKPHYGSDTGQSWSLLENVERQRHVRWCHTYEYTKITTPRQDVLFKKGYFGRKRTPNPSPSDTQEAHSGDSVESESYVSEDPQYVYPTGYMDPTGVYYVNGGTFETFDPYTGMVTVVVGPPPQYPGGAPVLAALPCQPVPLQPVEWFNPPAPWCYSYNRRKRYSTDSQNCSAQSSESTGPPGSPQEPVEEGACAPPLYPQQYVYPGYMFGPPVYNMNGKNIFLTEKILIKKK
ncbi:hypothetical protein J6590_009792 [Homalodisca vitripennis]|nr:hypothetical protein J6590_009792 [Homalodisca vitripennis]